MQLLEEDQVHEEKEKQEKPKGEALWNTFPFVGQNSYIYLYVRTCVCVRLKMNGASERDGWRHDINKAHPLLRDTFSTRRSFHFYSACSVKAKFIQTGRQPDRQADRALDAHWRPPKRPPKQAFQRIYSILVRKAGKEGRPSSFCQLIKKSASQSAGLELVKRSNVHTSSRGMPCWQSENEMYSSGRHHILTLPLDLYVCSIIVTKSRLAKA